MSKADLKLAFEEHSQTREDKVVYLSGNLGIALSGAKVVNVPGRSGYVFVRLLGNTSELIQAYNSEVSPIYDLPVLVTRIGNKWEVSGRDIKRYGNWGTASYLPPHGIQHTFDTTQHGGGDVVWVRSEQFLPLDLFPSVSGTGLTLYPYTYLWNNEWKQAIATGTADFTAYNPPAASGTSRMVLCYLDGNTGNPTLVPGNPFASTITGITGVLPYIPVIPMSTGIPLYAVRLENDTTYLTWDELYDLRQFYTSDISSSVGTSDHESLTGLLGGSASNHWHLTPAQITGLVSGTVTTLHSHTDIDTPYDSQYFTGTLWTDLTDGGETTLHKHGKAINYLINGGFDFFQRVTPATAKAMTDDAYNAPDRWYSLIQGANATINRNAGIGTSKYSCKIVAGGTTNRHGIAQIIEANNSIPLRGQTVTAQCRVKPVNNAGSGTRDYRIAILEWTGTADVVTSEVVNDWTSGTYTAGSFFASTTLTVVATANVAATHNTEAVLSVSGTISTSCNNLIVMIWAEDVPTHASDYVLIGEAGLYVSSTVQAWLPRLKEDERVLCHEYAYAPETDVEGAYQRYGTGFVNTATEAYFVFYLPQTMRVVPALSITAASNFYVHGAGFDIACTALTSNFTSEGRMIELYATVAGGLTAGQAVMIIGPAALSTDKLIFTAEL